MTRISSELIRFAQLIETAGAAPLSNGRSTEFSLRPRDQLRCHSNGIESAVQKNPWTCGFPQRNRERLEPEHLIDITHGASNLITLEKTMSGA